MKTIKSSEIIDDLKKLGIKRNDVVHVRAKLSEIGHIDGGASTFINALMELLGDGGTIVALAFTSGAFIRKPRKEDFFHTHQKSYVGSVPNEMINRSNSFRSKHPMCSFVAIGKHAEEIVSNHDHNSPAFEPVRKIVELQGKFIVIGCVNSNPGFTFTHLAEQDLGLLKLNIFSKLNSSYYLDENGKLALYRRSDDSLCSYAHTKFLTYYEKNSILKSGQIGDAYTILVPAKEGYEIDKQLLTHDKIFFTTCNSSDCWKCNAGRWDRIHYMPKFFFRLLQKKIGLLQ